MSYNQNSEENQKRQGNPLRDKGKPREWRKARQQKREQQ